MGGAIKIMATNILKPEQIALCASKAGFTGTNLVIAVAIALAESNGNALAIGDAQLDPYRSYGLWQINSHAHPNLIGLPANPSKWYDPFVNAKFAWKVSNGGSNWKPWSVYIHGTYNSRLTAAKAGVDLLFNGTVVSPNIIPPTTSTYPNKVNIRLTKPYMRDGVNGITGIKTAQTRLVKKGYSVGPDGADGEYGPNTTAGITAFQKKTPPLEVDGILGPLTWDRLV